MSDNTTQGSDSPGVVSGNRPNLPGEGECAACSERGFEHDRGCAYADDPVGVLQAQVDELEAELARWKAAWPDPDEYAEALRRELGSSPNPDEEGG